MRCVCCNVMLNDVETTAKYASTGEYSDTCGTCMKEIGIEYITRQDLDDSGEEDYDDLDDDEEDVV